MGDDHSIACLINQWGLRIERDLYFMRWPRTCRHCDGSGWQTFNVSLGHGNVDTVDELCLCSHNGVCPRCGAEGALDRNGDGPCPSCLWYWFPPAPAGYIYCSCFPLPGEDL